MTSTVTWSTLVLLLSVLPMVTAYHPDNATAIKKQIFTNYDNSVRPSSPTVINMNMVLFSLNELSIEKQEMSVTAVVYLIWDDFRLAWDPRLYDGLYTLMVQYGKIWQPHLVVENSVDVMRAIGDEEKPSARLYFYTYVKWLVPVNLRVFCKMSILAFPFDTQDCIIKIYMWGYDKTEVAIAIDEDGVFTDYYVENGEWDLIGSQKVSANVTDNEETYSKVQVILKFRRKWVFLGLTLIVPAVLNSLLMSAVFALPFESGEKMGYSLTVLLTYIVLLTLVADSLPPISTEISVLQIYLTGVMCVGTVATLLTVWTVTMYNQKPSKPRPDWLIKLVTKCLRPLLCQSCDQKSKKDTSGSQDGDGDNDMIQGFGRSQGHGMHEFPVAEFQNPNHMTVDYQRGENSRSQVSPHSEGVIRIDNFLLQNSSKDPSQFHYGSGNPIKYVASPHSGKFRRFGEDSRQTIPNGNFRGLSRGSHFTRSSGVFPENYEATGNAGYGDPFGLHDELDFRINDSRNRSKHFNHEDLSDKKQEKQNSKNRVDPESKGRDKRTPTEKARLETHQDNYSESTHDNKEVTWVEVAELMDALFLRIITLIIFLGTLALIIFYSVTYE